MTTSFQVITCACVANVLKILTSGLDFSALKLSPEHLGMQISICTYIHKYTCIDTYIFIYKCLSAGLGVKQRHYVCVSSWLFTSYFCCLRSPEVLQIDTTMETSADRLETSKPNLYASRIKKKIKSASGFFPPFLIKIQLFSHIVN